MLSLHSRRPFSSVLAGDRRSHRRGLSIEFSDYREYRPGDDLKYVDWKAYGRLEKLFLKLFVDEEDLNVHLLIDNSKSMSFGETTTKWEYAQRAAAAIGFIALHENNRVDAAAFNTAISSRTNPLRGDQSIPVFLKALEKLPPPDGGTQFSQVIRKYAASSPPSGLVIIFSDFFDLEIAAGLANLAARNHQTALIQVLDRLEVSPDFDGDINLIDSESGVTREVTLSSYEIQQYKTRLDQYTAELIQSAGKYGADFVRVVTDEPVETLVLHSLRTAGIVK